MCITGNRLKISPENLFNSRLDILQIITDRHILTISEKEIKLMYWLVKALKAEQIPVISLEQDKR